MKIVDDWVASTSPSRWRISAHPFNTIHVGGAESNAAPRVLRCDRDSVALSAQDSTTGAKSSELEKDAEDAFVMEMFNER